MEQDQQQPQPMLAASRELMADLGKLTPHDSLMLVARRAAEVLNAESTGIFRVDGDYLILEAGFGHREGFDLGKIRVPITADDGAGLTGSIAYHRQLRNLSGAALAGHPAVAGLAPHTPSGECFSLLAIPLLRNSANKEELIGLLRADNKKGPDGLIRFAGFDAADETSIRFLAEMAVVAIESAELVERLIRSSPHGIIAVDRKGKVTEFNRRAEDLLGWSRKEVLATRVEKLYADPAEARKIGDLLRRSVDGQVFDYETAVRHKGGEEIPILHSSTWLLDARRNRIGSIGYFADLRALRRMTHESLLLRASMELGKAASLDQGLRQLAEIMVEYLDLSICSILLMDPGQESLSLRAASARAGLDWNPASRVRIFIRHWPGLRDVLSVGVPRVWKESSRGAATVFRRLAKHLGLTAPIQSLLVAPLKIGNRIVGQLDLLQTDANRANFDPSEIELVSAIATQVTALIDHQEAQERTLDHRVLLQRISDAIQSIDDTDEVLSIILTGVTAGFGLGFNRAVVMRLDETGQILRGRAGIGEVEERKAREAWRAETAGEPSDLDSYLKRRAASEIPSTTVNRLARSLSLPLGGDAFGAVIEDKAPRCVPVEALSSIPPAFIETFHVTTPLAVVPLKAMSQVIGLLVVDNKFTQAPIGAEEMKSLMAFATTAAHAITSDRRKLFSFYRASSELLNLKDPSIVAEKSARLTLDAAGASWVSVLLIDAGGRAQNPIAVGRETDPHPGIRDDGISMQVMREGRACTIPDISLARDRVNPTLAESEYRAAICLPLDLAGRRLGVLWVHYLEPRQFPESEVAALLLFAGQVAIAYHSSRRLARLERVREAAARIAAASDSAAVLHEVAASAGKVLGSVAAAVWSYDSDRDVFDRECHASSVAHSLSGAGPGLNGPSANGFAHQAMQAGSLCAADFDPTAGADLLCPLLRALFAATNGRRLQGVALEVGGEKLGVICLLYAQPWAFDEDEREAGKAFADYAALAYKKVRLFEQVHRTKEAAKALARRTVLDNQKETLDSIAKETNEALGCKAVVIYEYDRGREAFIHPPALAGVAKNPWVETQEWESFLASFLRLAEPRIITEALAPADLTREWLTGGKDAGTTAAIALPTTAGSVGVMFVSYPGAHRVTVGDFETMQLFADQAAIMIRNRQLFRDLFGAQAKLARMGIAKGVRAHEINVRIARLRYDLDVLKKQCASRLGDQEEILRRFDAVDTLGEQVRQLTEGLAKEVEEGIASVAVNDAFLRSWQRTLDLNPRRSFEACQASMNFELENDAKLAVDPQLLSFIFDTIIQNALNAVAGLPAPAIGLSTRRMGDRVGVSVSNNGPSIAEEILAKLFQEPIEHSGPGGGLGRGLLIARSIARMYNGSIDVVSLPDDITMTVSLPLGETADSRQRRTAEVT